MTILKHKTNGSKPVAQNWNGYNVYDGRSLSSKESLGKELGISETECKKLKYEEHIKELKKENASLKATAKDCYKTCEDLKELREMLIRKDKWHSESQGLMRLSIKERDKKIQSLEAQLKNAREKNRKQNLLLGKAQKRASKVCAVKLTNQNKHLREQLKKVTKRYEELK